MADESENNEGELGIEKSDEISFTYTIDDVLLDFKILPDRKIRCAYCKRTYKNIHHHLRKGSCKVSGLEELSLHLSNFIKLNFAEQKKKDNCKRKAKSRELKQNMNYDKAKKDEAMWKANSRARLRLIDETKFKRDNAIR